MSQFDLTNKVAIVTGGGTGIGRSIALEFAKAGADVVIGSLEYVDRVGKRVPVNLDSVAKEIESLGKGSLAIATDVRIPEQVDNLIKQTVNRFGRIDILVNNAGTTFVCPVEKLTPNGWDAIMDINLKGTFLCSQAAGKVMIQQKSGKIINIVSVTGISGSAKMAHYGAAKAGIINFTKSLAMEWAQYNININAIAPGYIETEGAKLIVEQSFTGPAEQNMESVPLLARPGQPEDIAYTAIFLASEASRYISGETVIVRGVAGTHE